MIKEEYYNRKNNKIQYYDQNNLTKTNIVNEQKTFDLDNVAKNLYKSNTSINKKVLDVFPSVSSTENQINTKKLGDLVFNDSYKLNKLQEIIWPEVEKFIQDEIDFSKELIVFEGAVIIEAGWHKFFDHICQSFQFSAKDYL